MQQPDVPQSPQPAVAILLATYNGAAMLQGQLDSYAAQELKPKLLMVSDDGSVDETRDILRRFAEAHPEIEVELFDGPRLGAAQNFLHLLRQMPDTIDYVALSDQDDVWFPTKLARGVALLQTLAEPERPGLACGRTLECDDALNNRRLSRGAKRPAGFRHALVQNIAGGNTMVLNRAAIALVRGAAQEVREVVVHDWWLYQIVTGAGGEVIFDNEPQLLYRQHEGNLIGANRGLGAKLYRLRFLVSGRFRLWCTTNLDALHCSAGRLTEENLRLVRAFEVGRDGPVWTRIAMIRRCGFYRQGLAGQMSLYLGALLRRI